MALIDTFSETFPGTTLPAAWVNTGTAPVIADGHATYSRAAGAGQVSRNIRTSTRYAIAGSSVRVRLYVESGAPSGASCRVYLYNSSTGVQPVGLYLNNPAGQIYFYWYDASNVSQFVTLDTPAGTEWVRLRDGGSGVIHLDTSPDGVAWTDFTNTGSAIYLYADDYNLALGTLLPSDADASSVVFDQVNGVAPATSRAIGRWTTDGPTPVTGTAVGNWALAGAITSAGSALWNVDASSPPLALIETLFDPFDGTTLDTDLWVDLSDPGVTLTIHDGVAEWVRIGTTGLAAGAIDPVDLYSLTDSSLVVQITTTVGGASGGPIFQFLDSGAILSFLLYAGYPSSYFWYIQWVNEAGSPTTLTTVVFDPAATHYRFTGSSVGHLVVESSVGGSSWIELFDTGEPVRELEAVRARMGAIFNADGASTVTLAQVGEEAAGTTEVTSTAGGLWGLAGAITTTRAGAWNLGGPTTTTASATWEVQLLHADAEAAAEWDLFTVVSKTITGRWNVEPAPPVEWTGVVAAATSEAGEGIWALDSGYWLIGATASARAIAVQGLWELGAGPPVWEADTAEIIGTANPGMFLTGDQIVGDSFYLPVVLTGLTGTGIADLASATLQAGEPYTHGMTRTWWFRYDSPGPGVLTLTSTDATFHFLDVYQGEEIGDLEVLATAERDSTLITIATAVSHGSYYIRVSSTVADSSVLIGYSLAITEEELIVENLNPIVEQTPAYIIVSALNAEPGEDVQFTWRPPPSVWASDLIPRPIELFVYEADETGALVGIGIPLPAVGAGLQTIYVTGLTSGRTDTITVVIEEDSEVPEGVTAPEAPPEFVVGRWSMHDARPGGLGTVVFPINPSTMTSPHAPRNITPEHTTAADGQPILWESGLIAHDWNFAGYLETEAFHDDLVAFADLNRRFYLHDHRGRTWEVAFEGIDIKPRRNIDKPWAHDYTVAAHIYRQVV